MPKSPEGQTKREKKEPIDQKGKEKAIRRPDTEAGPSGISCISLGVSSNHGDSAVMEVISRCSSLTMSDDEQPVITSTPAPSSWLEERPRLMREIALLRRKLSNIRKAMDL